MKVSVIYRRLAMILAVVLIFAFSGVAMASGDGGHGEEHATKGWINTDTYRVLNFAVLAIALFLILRKPASQMLEARIKGIKDQLSELDAKKKETNEEFVRYNEKLQQLEKEAEKIIEDYIRQGKDASALILKEAEGIAGKLEEQAKRNIEYEFEAAKLRLQSEVLEKALTKAEEIIRSRITDDDQERLVDEYLEKVVAS